MYMGGAEHMLNIPYKKHKVNKSFYLGATE